MNEKIVVSAEGYDRVDGRNAYRSHIKRITLGAPALEENQSMQIAAQLWTAQEDGTLKMSAELPIHQVFDLMIVLSRTLLYFKEAYRFPLSESDCRETPFLCRFVQKTRISRRIFETFPRR